VLKGAAVAHLDYSDPARRAYGDVDVLVPAHRLDRAVACLDATGARRRYAELRPGFDRRFGKGMSFRMPSGFEVDVHRTLVLGPFGLSIDLDELLARTETFSIGDHQLRGLDRPRRFVHACLHAELGRSRPRLLPLIDVTRTAPRTDAERDSVRTLVRRWSADAVVLAATESARAELGWELPPELTVWLDRLDPTPRQQRWMKAYRGGRRSSARLSVVSTEAIRGWRNRLDYVAALAWPSGSTVTSAVARGAQRLSVIARSDSR
jgi:hypothetical protein